MQTFKFPYADRTLPMAVASQAVYPISFGKIIDLNNGGSGWAVDAYRLQQRRLLEKCRQQTGGQWPFELVLQISCLLQLDEAWRRQGNRYEWVEKRDMRPACLEQLRCEIKKYSLTKEEIREIVRACLLGLPHEYFVSVNPDAKKYLRGLYDRVQRNMVPLEDLGPWFRELTQE